eukprot:1327927-Amphidinium_carterae.2
MGPQLQARQKRTKPHQRNHREPWLLYGNCRLTDGVAALRVQAKRLEHKAFTWWLAGHPSTMKRSADELVWRESALGGATLLQSGIMI